MMFQIWKDLLLIHLVTATCINCKQYEATFPEMTAGIRHHHILQMSTRLALVVNLCCRHSAVDLAVLKLKLRNWGGSKGRYGCLKVSISGSWAMNINTVTRRFIIKWFCCLKIWFCSINMIDILSTGKSCIWKWSGRPRRHKWRKI